MSRQGLSLCAQDWIYWGKYLAVFGGKYLAFFGTKHPNYFGRGQKFWDPYVRKPPRYPVCIVLLFVAPNWPERPIFGPKWPKCIFWAKFGLFWPNNFIFGKFWYWLIRKPPRHLVRILFWSWDQIGRKITFFVEGAKLIPSYQEPMRRLFFIKNTDWRGLNGLVGTKMCNFDPKTVIFVNTARVLRTRAG